MRPAFNFAVFKQTIVDRGIEQKSCSQEKVGEGKGRGGERESLRLTVILSKGELLVLFPHSRRHPFHDGTQNVKARMEADERVK